VTEVVDVRGRRREQTRGEILDAAWRLAERDGLATLSLRDLAAEVGMRAPSLYTYFAGKAAIFDAMFAQGYEQLDAVYADLTLDAADPAAALTDATVKFVHFCQASIPRYQLLFTRVVADWQPSPEAYAASVASYERMVDRLALLGVVGEHALDLWTAITAGLAAQQLANDPSGDRWVALSRDATEMFLAHLRRKR
jgi:AcrR family transcriptional regulator